MPNQDNYSAAKVVISLRKFALQKNPYLRCSKKSIKLMKSIWYGVAIIATVCLFANCKRHNNQNVQDMQYPLSTNMLIYVDSPFALIAPTAFTPNGDGINDAYGIFCTDTNSDSFLLKVIRTNGDVVFQTTDRMFRWDGTVNGKLAQDYGYNVSIRFRDTKSGQLIDTTTYLFCPTTDTTRWCLQVPDSDIPKYLFGDQIDPNNIPFFLATMERFCP
jgi:gliding motility-associated-like protein